MTAQEHPEPVEPTMASVPGGIYCLVHGVMDCTEPFCWRCGNHQMDDFGRCSDPRCRASNDEMSRERVEEVKRAYPDRPAPLEVIALAIGLAWMGADTPSWRDTPDNPSFLVPGEPGGGGAPEPSVPATGAGPVVARRINEGPGHHE